MQGGGSSSYLPVDISLGSRSNGNPTKEFKYGLALRGLIPYHGTPDNLNITG